MERLAALGLWGKGGLGAKDVRDLDDWIDDYPSGSGQILANHHH